jgi:hypothetical protein
MLIVSLVLLLTTLFSGFPIDNGVPAIAVVPVVAGISAVVGITTVAASTAVAGATSFNRSPAIECLLKGIADIKKKFVRTKFRYFTQYKLNMIPLIFSKAKLDSASVYAKSI